MNTEAIMPAKIMRHAKLAIGIGQKQVKEAVSLYKVHGKQFLEDGAQMVNSSKALIKDLRDLQMDSVSELKKAFTEEPKKAKRSGATKKAPEKEPEAVEAVSGSNEEKE